MVPHAFEAQAIQEAIESGMARFELMAILGGLRITDLIPPRQTNRRQTMRPGPRANSRSATSADLSFSKPHANRADGTLPSDRSNMRFLRRLRIAHSPTTRRLPDAVSKLSRPEFSD